MARTGRPKARVKLTAAERQVLERWARRAKAAQGRGERADDGRAAAGGGGKREVAPRLGGAPFRRWADALLMERGVDGVGLYHTPPGGGVVLCVDEKSQIRALARSQRVLRMMPGMPERRPQDYARHGITSLFAAFNTADGTVISELHRQHRATEFKKFLVTIDQAVPPELDIHLICDNYGTHKTPAIKAWLARHPRFHMHFTPTGSSWINQVERWFGYLTDQKIRRGSHKSIQTLEKDIRDWIADWNTHP